MKTSSIPDTLPVVDEPGPSAESRIEVYASSPKRIVETVIALAAFVFSLCYVLTR